MKKILLLSVTTLLTVTLMAQNDSTSKRKKEPIDLSNRPNDHFMIQAGYLGWSGKPDSIKTEGLSKSVNVYFMFDFPFKTNPKISVGVGAGIASDHLHLSKTGVEIKSASTLFHFTNTSDTDHFKKTSLNTTYFEAPVEIRYTTNPLNPDKGFKFAIGAKVGTMINAHTRNKDLQNKNNTVITAYTQKETSKHYFNNNRLSIMGRVGSGHFTLFASYQVTALFKDGAGAEIHPYTLGLTISGL